MAAQRRAWDKALETTAPLIVVAAPAGYGKSTLVARLAAAWQAERPRPVPVRGGSRAATPTEPGSVDFRDDGAALDCARMQALLVQAAGGRRQVVTSRTLPSLDWLSLQLEGRVCVIDAEDLRLSLEEARGLLEAIAPGQYDAVGAEQLHRDTAGWPAVILGTARTPDQGRTGRSYPAQLQAPTGASAAFFEQSIDRALPADVLDLVARTSVLDLLSPEAVEVLLGHEWVAVFARARDEFMLFVASERSGFFELPPMLRRHLLAAHPLPRDQQKPLLVAASRWHLENDMADMSIEYLLRARRPDEAAAIFAAQGPRIRMRRGDNPRMLDWLDRIIALGGRIGVDLQLWRVWALVYSLRVDEAEALLDGMEPELDTADRVHHAFAGRLRVSIAARRDDLALTEELAEAWLKRWAESDPLEAAGVALMQSLVYAYRQEDRPCRRMLLLARQYAVHAGNDAANLWTMGIEALTELHAGRALLALDIVERAHAQATRAGGMASPVAKLLSVIAAAIHLELDDLAAVGRHLGHGYASTPSYGMPDTHLAAQEAITGYMEQTAGANAALVSVHQEGISGWRYAQSGHLLAVKVLLRAGRTEEARTRFNAVRDAMAGRVDAISDQEFRAAEAWILFAQGEHAGARDMLLPLLAFADAHGQRRRFASHLLMRAACEWAAGDTRSAQRCFSRAIGIASSGQLMRTVLDLGWALRDMLGHMHEDEVSPEADRFLRTVMQRLRPAGTIEEDAVLIEPLTGREGEVLRLLDSGLRAKDIAVRLDLSVCTLKWHIQNIYGKLNVRNRSGAITVARRCGLV